MKLYIPNRIDPKALPVGRGRHRDKTGTLAFRHALGFLVLAFSALASQAQTAASPQAPLIDIVRNVPYGHTAGVGLLLDVYRPKVLPKEPLPAIVWIHGGAWQYGDKEKPMAGWLAQHGYFVVSINYRLAPQFKFPAPLEDSKCAVRWLRANAGQMRVDPDRIGVWGGSAGGHLAALVGLTPGTKEFEGNGGHADQSSAVRAVCAFFPPTHWEPSVDQDPQQRAICVNFLGGTFAQVPHIYRKASPVTYAHSNAPPFLLVHGEADSVVSISQSERLDAALRKASATVTLVRVQNAEHGFQPVGGRAISPSFQEIQRAVIGFFDRFLKDGGASR